MRRDFERRILCDITRRLFPTVFDKKCSEAAQENIFLTNLRGAHLFHETLHDSRYGRGLDACFPGDLLISSCFVIDAYFLMFSNLRIGC